MKKGGRVKLTMWHRTVLRAAAEHPIVLNEISEPMREKLIDLAMMEPPRPRSNTASTLFWYQGPRIKL